jgi:hypothetical protein
MLSVLQVFIVHQVTCSEKMGAPPVCGTPIRLFSFSEYVGRATLILFLHEDTGVEHPEDHCYMGYDQEDRHKGGMQPQESLVIVRLANQSQSHECETA